MSILKVWLSLILFLYLGTLNAQKEVSIKEAITKSAELEVLTQHIVKVYFALNNNLSEPKFYQERDFAINSFEECIERLKLLIPNNDVRKALTEMREHWVEYKKIAAWAINKEGANKLYQQSSVMLVFCQKLSLAYKNYAKKNGNIYQTGSWVKISSGLRRVVQKRIMTHQIVYHFFAIKLGIGSSPNFFKRKLEDLSTKYDLLLHDLLSEEVNTLTIQKEIMEVQRQWGALSKQMKANETKGDTAGVAQVLHFAQQITDRGNGLMTLYHNLGEKLSISNMMNKVAEQNFVIQQIAKSFVAIAFEQQASRYKKEIILSIRQFEKGTDAFIHTAPTEEIKASAKVMQLMWKNYRIKALDLENIDVVKVSRLLEMSYRLMASVDAIFLEVNRYAQTMPSYTKYIDNKSQKENIITIIKAVGKQRIYSQSIVTHYMMCALDKDIALQSQRLKEAILQYNNRIILLEKGTYNDATIEYVLDKTNKEWKAIESLIDKINKQDINLVIEFSDILSERLVQLSNLYEAKMDEVLTKEDNL